MAAYTVNDYIMYDLRGKKILKTDLYSDLQAIKMQFNSCNGENF